MKPEKKNVSKKMRKKTCPEEISNEERLKEYGIFPDEEETDEDEDDEDTDEDEDNDSWRNYV